MEKIRRCHCGAEAKLAHYTTWDGQEVYDVRCTQCNTHVSIPPETAKQAIAEWNNRRVYTQIRRWEKDNYVEDNVEE